MIINLNMNKIRKNFSIIQKKSIFSNLSLKIKKGKMIGFLVKVVKAKQHWLITGILKPTKGKIFFDKIKIDEL